MFKNIKEGLSMQTVCSLLEIRTRLFKMHAAHSQEVYVLTINGTIFHMIQALFMKF